MGKTTEVRSAETTGWLNDCIEAVARAFDEFSEARGPVSQATALAELNDRIFDLKTYHPGYDFNSGTMPYDRDEASA